MSHYAQIRPEPGANGDAGRVIAIASGKGGVGKTWLAITLAHILASRQARVLLFDGDFGLANIDIQLGLTPRHDLSDVAAGRIALREAVLNHKDADVGRGGFDILPGRSGASALAALATPALDTLLNDLRGLAEYDTVLLDLGAGIDRVTRRLAAWADTLLVVTTDEPTALTDAYAVLKLHARDRQVLCGLDVMATDARVVVNQVSSSTGGDRAYATLAKACSNFLGSAPSLAGIIRKDPSVSEAIRRQALLVRRHPNTIAALDVTRVAENLRP